MTTLFNLKNILVAGVVVLGLISLGLYTNVIKLPITKGIHPGYVTDFSNDQAMMGASHNVFVGKAVKQIGTKSDIGIPQTQFEVEVIHNIKGELQGAVMLNQLGGYKNGILYLVHGGDVIVPENEGGMELLRSGATYVLATRYSDVNDWYNAISHPNARKLVSENEGITKGALETLAKNDPRVIELREAYKNEILLDADIQNNNTRNSYRSLQKN